MKSKSKPAEDELRAEYEFDYSKAVRGKHCRRLLDAGANVVVLEPDVAEAFQDSAAVNDALRSLLNLARSTQCAPKRPGRGAAKPLPRSTQSGAKRG